MTAAVRPVRADEWETLRELRLRALREDATAFGDTLAKALARTDDDWRRYAFDGEGAVTFVAVVDGRFAGMSRGRVLGGDAGLFGMWVAPEARRCGLGRVLVNEVVGWARGKGVARVVLEVADDRPAPCALYAACGFEDTGARRPNESHPGVTECEMAIVLRR